MILKRLAMLLWVLAIVLPVLPIKAQSDRNPAYADVLYVQDGDPMEQVLDIYLPEGEGPFPAVFMIHCQGCSKWDYQPHAAHFANLDYATISIEYRDVSQRAPLGPLEDSICALAWVHANAAEYQIDPQRIVVLGHSQGGYAAAMLGTLDDPALFAPDCPTPMPEEPLMVGVIDYAGALLGVPTAAYALLYEREQGEIRSFVETLTLLPPAQWQDLSGEIHDFVQLLPYTWINGNEPPFLIFHGTIDNKVRVRESELLATTLEDAGDQVELVLLQGAGHGMRLYQRVPTLEVDEKVEAFLAEVFGD